MDYQKSLLNKIMNNYKDEDKCKQKSLNQIIVYLVICFDFIVNNR